tara:strand:- start:3192 stop:4070 length:879 start_codon:yes stop_codon:yes gene_type:complete
LGFQPVPDDRDKAICDDGTIDLDLDRVHACSPEGFYPQMLFHPFEEQLDLPPFLVQKCYFCGIEVGVVGQEDEFLFGLAVIILDPAELFGIALFGIMPFELARLVIFDTFGLVGRSGVHPFEAQVLLGPCNEKGLLQVDGVQSRKVDICLVHHVKASGLERYDVENVDIVQAGIGYMDEARDRGHHIVKDVELYPSLGLSELRPPEHAQAKVYGCRIQRVHVALDVDLEIVPVIAFPGLPDKDIRELLEDPVAPFFVGLAKVAPRNRGPEPQVVILGAVRLKAQHQVPHTVP